MIEEYKYEVAFSFLTRDEAQAQCLCDLLQDRISTFIYPERQIELAGKDGEMMLKKAFGSEARLVVILYRNEWGSTSWTRIEQDAIRERGFNEGYDFCLLIPLENPPDKPQWFPPNRLWIGLQRWGNEAAAAVIEARVQEAGGATRQESVMDRKTRLEREVLAAERRKAYLESDQAVAPANKESRVVLDQIEQLARSMSTANFPLVTKQKNECLEITSQGFMLQSFWSLAYSNTLANSAFYVRLFERNRNDNSDRDLQELTKLQFKFDIDETDRNGWRATRGDMRFFLSRELAEFALRMILDKVAEFRKRKANER